MAIFDSIFKFANQDLYYAGMVSAYFFTAFLRCVHYFWQKSLLKLVAPIGSAMLNGRARNRQPLQLFEPLRNMMEQTATLRDYAITRPCQ